ncbi:MULTISPECIES: cytochrome c biogenesis protein [Methanohalobium]|uniref:Cytochrome c assembly protein n=1 Tax=Methanohalobium evestigatum (strain ATCC BAA-1072 / DSM 3721 / NBRC 107634 / OCM 161 / Z-7303) TaxID=644295 RepID=D7E9L0_METEZ|nr:MULTISPECIES: cytochrome c biogenesis protein [Methanohalobium]ADI74282.1 cytochrome c assembly protein [Methanohalobium evestigatum Z-7303]
MLSSESKKVNLLAVLTTIAIIVATGMIFFYLPQMTGGSSEVLGESFKIFYIHLPIAFTSYLAFFIVFVAGIMYLRSSNKKWDILARSSAEVGIGFAFLVIATGSIWAKAVWGWYWIWEPRLTTSLVLLLVYLAYFMVRQSIDEPETRARLSSIFGIVGFAAVPLSFLSVRLWRSVHPLMFGESIYGGSGGGLEGPSLILTLLVNFIAFFMLFATLFVYKIQNEELKEQVNDLKQSME